MKTPNFNVDLPPIDENTPEKEILDNLLATYKKISKNIRSVRTQAEELQTERDTWTEDELRTGFKQAMVTLSNMTDTLEYAYDHVRIISVILRAKEK